MNDSSFKKIIIAFSAFITHPVSSLSWVRRGQLLQDREVISQTYWLHGRLPRVPVAEIFPSVKDVDISLPRAFNRTFKTSITFGEAGHLAALVKCTRAKRVLEIGTFDGNTTLLFAMNLPTDGTVVTVDLPPDFNPKKDQSTLGHPETKINLTPRELVAGQYQGHPLATKITQVYGDSASLDWSTLRGPFDLIFIDGCHKEAYVRSDSKNALSQLAPGGIIVWHDYGDITDVSLVVDEVALNNPHLSIRILEGTRLALGINEKPTP